MNKYLLLLLLMSWFTNTAYAAKKECAVFLNKYHNIQAQQRQGQSIKSSNNLRKKEDLARERWWDCENNKTTNIKKKNNKKPSAKSSKINENKTIKHYKNDKEPILSFSSNKLVLKGRYSGDKQFKWLDFYKRPKKCLRPKSTQIFAYCMDHKEKHQTIFEQQYTN